MKTWTALLVCALLAACATTPPAPPPPRVEHLFNDALFGRPSERVDRDDVFRLSDDMRHHLGGEIAVLLRNRQPQRALIEALYQNGRLKLEYNTEITRTASQTYRTRSPIGGST